MQPGQHLQVVLDRLFQQVVVVPDEAVRGVHRLDGLDVAGLDRGGYLNARISDIAAEAGKSVASFYNYYDTKAALLIALAEDFHTEATEMAVLPYRSGLAPPPSG